ncbi:Os04g0563950, partial [Oryza sativa Japonica Group]
RRVLPRRRGLGTRPDPLDLHEGLDDLGHGGPAPGVPGEAAQRELGRLLRRPGRVLPLQARVHQPRQLPPVRQVRLGPLHEAVLRRRPPRVQRPHPRQHLQQHHAEPVHVALHVQVPCIIN